MKIATTYAESYQIPEETLQSEALYSKIAARYDDVFIRAILAEGILTEVTREVMNGKRVLDIGCGNGRWLNRFKPSSYVGLDLNDGMLNEAKIRYPRAQFVQANMTHLPFPNESFDGIISMFGAMCHLPLESKQIMVRESTRVLVPGGMAIFTNGYSRSPSAIAITATGGRVRMEGVPIRVHYTTPKMFAKLLSDFRLLRIEHFDYSYIPILPFKFIGFLCKRNYKEMYLRWMNLFNCCRKFLMTRWLGKYIMMVCQKP